ncbi:hypothetical protein C8J56DRAFT_979544 [Mycena floridula]|nr:hypothetical protein C8J56DRAFT_979544 [Mycena floridula]
MGLLELFKDPFGPYPEENILASWPVKRALKMTEVHMEWEDEVTGLDETELIAAPSEKRPPIYFFGVVEIEKLSWLSVEGKAWLQQDLRTRDMEINDRTSSGLTLDAFHATSANKDLKPPPILVRLRCLRQNAVTFLNDGKSIIARAHPKFKTSFRRTYEIVGMQARTLYHSRDFLQQWRIFGFASMLGMTDKHPPPMHERTFEWLVVKYLEYHHTLSVNLRLINDPDDQNIDETGRITNSSDKLRHPRPISRAEIARVLARHAEWFLAQQIVSSRVKPLVNLHEWYNFCRLLQKEPKAWGLNRPARPNQELDLTRFGETQTFWANRLKKFHKPAPIPVAAAAASESEPESMTAGELIYDEDFSEASTPPASDSELSEEESWVSASQDKLTKLPFLQFKPELSSGSFTWNCPANDYHMDFLHLRDRDMIDLPDDLVVNLKAFKKEATDPSKSHLWNSSEERFLLMFYRLAEHHYLAAHLNPLGIHDRESRNGITLWEKRDRTRPIKQQKPNRIKVEDNDMMQGIQSTRVSSVRRRSARLQSLPARD